jgi:hypothetical protein
LEVLVVNVESKTEAAMFCGIVTPQDRVMPVPTEAQYPVMLSDLGLRSAQEFANLWVPLCYARQLERVVELVNLGQLDASSSEIVEGIVGA